jgi:hypothetical protein
MTEYRRILPQRRRSETFTMRLDAMRVFEVTVGHYPDGSVGEVFITGAKAGTDMDSANRDSAILLSLALQHHVPLETIRHAITRNKDGTAASIVGAVIDRIVVNEKA